MTAIWRKDCPEPTEAILKGRLPNSSANQRNPPVAGLGNIYVDEEVLCRAKVHPARLGQSLTAREAKVIRKETIAVLAWGCRKRWSRSYSNAFGEDAPCKINNFKSMERQVNLCLRQGHRLGNPAGRTWNPFLPVKRRTRWQESLINRRDCFRKSTALLFERKRLSCHWCWSSGPWLAGTRWRTYRALVEHFEGTSF